MNVTKLHSQHSSFLTHTDDLLTSAGLISAYQARAWHSAWILSTFLRPQHHTLASSLCGRLFHHTSSPTACAGPPLRQTPCLFFSDSDSHPFLTMPQCDTLLNLTGPQHSMLSHCSAETASSLATVLCLAAESYLRTPVLFSLPSIFLTEQLGNEMRKKGRRGYFLFNLF